MHKVMVVDDESIVRKGIKTLINWDLEGFVICAEGKDGKDGLAKILDYAPDLVLIDIKMPGLNGIEVVQQARNQGFKGQFVILTGYSEFEFAKSAISLGVKEYLLKPIDEDELLEIVRQIRIQLEEEERLDTYHSRNEEEAKKELLRRILLNNIETRSSIEKEMELYKLDLNYGILCVAVCQDEIILDGENNRIYEKINILTEYDTTCIEKIIIDGHMILIERDVDYHRWAERLARNNQKVKEKYGNPISIAVGFNVYQWYDIYHSYEFARYLLEHIFLFGHDKVLSIDFLQKSEEEKNITVEYMEMLLEIGDAEGIKKCVTHFKEYCANHFMKESDIKIQVIQNLMFLKNKLSQKYGADKFTDSELQIAMETVISTEVLDELLKRYLSVLENLFQKIGNTDSDAVIKRVYYYMEKNYEKDLKLESIAKLFNYNSAYLGKLFRKEIGESFNNVLDTIRITNARRLLEETDMKVYQISEMVGYGNIDYYYMKFRKYMGISPKEYRKSLNFKDTE